MSQLKRIVVVGAGIAGPALAMWLARLGFEVILTEASAGPRSAEGAFLGVAPNGMAALAGLGLAQRVLDRGHPCSGFVFLNRRGRTLGTIDRSQDCARFGWPLTMIRRAELHGLLADACAERGVAPRYGLRLTGLQARADRVIARFADGSALEADLLVGCDGLRSATRALALPDAPAPTFSGLLDFGGFARVHGLPFPAGVNEMVFGKRAFFGAFTANDGETWWFHNGPATNDVLDPEQHRARILELHREDPPWIAELIRASSALLGPWPIHDLLAMPGWSKGRVCLIGDAAHAMSPSAGQGASLALEDAQMLAQCLRDVPDPASAYALLERLRRPRVDAMFAAARRNGSGKAPSPLGAWLRDHLLPLVLPIAGRQQSKAYAYRLEWEQPLA